MYRANFSICGSISVISPTGRSADVGSKMCLVQARANIRAHDKLDALDLGLHEHDPHVFRLGRVGVPAQRLDRIRL